jgi:hypothetical protein
VEREQLEGVSEIVTKSGIDGLRIMFRLQLSFIDANELLSLARFLAETIVSDSIKPGRETGLAPEAAEVFVGAQKSFLREIVRERKIGADELAEQPSHARLMVPDQFRKGVMVVIEKNAGDEVCIG